jgi:hypothetical protein
VNFYTILGLWELGSFEMLIRLFKSFDLALQPMVIADVGANIGFYSMFFSANLHPGSTMS